MPNLKAAATVLHDYGQRSTLHGLSHMHQSGDMWRRAFWLVLTFGGSIACFYHTYATVANYLESPITSIFRDEGAEAVFPDVTLCNLKPVSETLLHTPSERRQLFNHLETNWNFFRDWLPENRHRKVNESRVAYKLRQRNLFKAYMDVFWVSDDTRDFGLSDRHMLLSCTYKGSRCDSSNLKLIQHNRYWNCYTFAPPGGDRTIESSDEDSGLRLILFTDSNFDSDRLDDRVQYQRRMLEEDEMLRPYDLENYLSAGDRTMNQVLTGNSLEAEGLRIFVHRDGQHPMSGGLAYDISNGASTTIEFSEVLINVLNSPPEHVCNEKEPEKIRYVRYFGESAASTGLKSYSLTQTQAVIQEKQRLVFHRCGCYSHLLPFQFNTSLLCFFAPKNERRRPSQMFLDSISCHDRAYAEAESSTATLMERTEAYTPCTSRKLHATKVEVPWPRPDEIVDFVNYIVMPTFLLLEEEDVMTRGRLNHHLLSDSNSSRSQSVLDNLFNASCRVDQNRSLIDSWCLSKHKLVTNVARVWVKPDSPRAAVYMEAYSYDWPEALSEIGGIFGLWLGISLLSVCEFVELIFILLTACMSKDRRQNPRGMGRFTAAAADGCPSAGSLLSPELEAVLRQLLGQAMDEDWDGGAAPQEAAFTGGGGGPNKLQQRQRAELGRELAADSPAKRRPMQFQQSAAVSAISDLPYMDC